LVLSKPSAITALIEIVDDKGGGEAQKRVKNLAKRLLFDFRERWKPDEACQFQEGGVVTIGHGIRQVVLDEHDNSSKDNWN
jgi:hypothetical protein